MRPAPSVLLKAVLDHLRQGPHRHGLPRPEVVSARWQDRRVYAAGRGDGRAHRGKWHEVPPLGSGGAKLEPSLERTLPAQVVGYQRPAVHTRIVGGSYGIGQPEHNELVCLGGQSSRDVLRGKARDRIGRTGLGTNLLSQNRPWRNASAVHVNG